jgi:outer membrane biosynthesis protein TonB
VLRRAFRNGLLVGLLGGAIAAALKAVQGRVTSTEGPVAAAPTWTPLPNAEPLVTATAPATAPKPPRPKVDLSALQESPVEPAPEPAPAKKKASKPKPPPPWVEPGPDGEPPESHPIKAKMSSGKYHVPGGFNYPRTKPDRCYRDVAAAEADGLRPAKR